MKSYEFCMILLSLIVVAKSRKPPTKMSLFPGRLLMSYEFFQDCENVSGLVVHNSKVKIITFGPHSSSALSAEIKSDRLMGRLDRTVITIQKCDDKTEATCQIFQSWRLGEESCAYVQMKNQFWSSIFESIHPSIRCPIEQGIYELRNGTLDVKLLQAMPFPALEKYFWRNRFEVYEAENPGKILCVDFGVHFYRTRSH